MHRGTSIKSGRVSRGNPASYRVFFDFDNTITSFDVLDAIIEKFSRNQQWRSVECSWQRGDIGSRECLDAQIRELRVRKHTLIRYLAGIRIDPAFGSILSLLSLHRITPIIVSDSFSFIIRTILAANGIGLLPVYANRLRFSGTRLIPIFAHTDKRCAALCAHCKKKTLLDRIKSDTITIYIGDGLSDVCASLEATLVFAKANLARQLDRHRKPYIPFESLETVRTCLREVLHE
ncbi:MAG: MtnX-like HAD-IB family phosphatase [Candidatus Omnitrophota bacterium]|nr:MtnX-like HAD-IB family phosphatase [Candidatus Omnitrophota bacterium]